MNYDQILREAAYNGDLDVVKLMLEKDAKDVKEAMAYAAVKKHLEIVKLLLEKGANNLNRASYEAAAWGVFKKCFTKK